MKNINDIFYWLISTGTLGVVVKFAWSYIKPVLEEKEAHAKAEKARTEWAFLDQVADAAVHAMDSKPKTGSEKFASAVEAVNSALLYQNMDMSEKSVKTAVQSAYEKADLKTKKPDAKETPAGIKATPENLTAWTYGENDIPVVTKKPVIKSVVKATPQEITTSIASPQANLKDMPGASKKAEAKPYSPENAKSIKGIPTDSLEDIAVQAPKKEEGADNGN